MNLAAPIQGQRVWVEFNGPPEALRHFDDLIDSVTAQLALRNASGQTAYSKN